RSGTARWRPRTSSRSEDSSTRGERHMSGGAARMRRRFHLHGREISPDRQVALYSYIDSIYIDAIHIGDSGPRPMDVKTLCLAVLFREEATGYEIKKAFEEGPFAHF